MPAYQVRVNNHFRRALGSSFPRQVRVDYHTLRTLCDDGYMIEAETHLHITSHCIYSRHRPHCLWVYVHHRIRQSHRKSKLLGRRRGPLSTPPPQRGPIPQ